MRARGLDRRWPAVIVAVATLAGAQPAAAQEAAPPQPGGRFETARLGDNTTRRLVLPDLPRLRGAAEARDIDELPPPGNVPGDRAVVATSVREVQPDSDDGPADADAITRELQNPATPLATLNTKWEYRTFAGDLPDADSQYGAGVLFQPAFPFPIGEGMTFAVRPAIPIFFHRPYFDAADPLAANPHELNRNVFDSPVAGMFQAKSMQLGDIGFDAAFTKAFPSRWVLLGGMAGTLPTATDDVVGGDQWRAGPEFLVAKLNDWGVLAALVSHQWDVGGSNEERFSLTAVNYIYAFNLGNAWVLSGAPILTYDHQATDDNAWSVPVGLGIFKTVVLGRTPWKIGVEVQRYVVKPDTYGAEWYVQLVTTPVVPNIFANWLGLGRPNGSITRGVAGRR